MTIHEKTRNFTKSFVSFRVVSWIGVVLVFGFPGSQ